MGISQSAEVPRERSRGREQERERPSPTPATVPELSKEEIDKKTKAILDEYLHIQDMRVIVSFFFFFSFLEYEKSFKIC